MLSASGVAALAGRSGARAWATSGRAAWATGAAQRGLAAATANASAKENSSGRFGPSRSYAWDGGVLERVSESGSGAEEEKRKFANISSVSSRGNTIRWYKRASVEMVLPSGEEGRAFTTNLHAKDGVAGVKEGEILPGAFSAGLDAGVQYRVLLDDKAILTPGKNKLWAASLPLAAAVAAEWEAQLHTIRPHTMPLMTLCTTVLDHVPQVRQTMIGFILQHLQTDSVCYRAAQTKESDLYRLQMQKHQPLVEWFQDKFQVPLKVVEDGRLDCPGHDEYTMDAIRWLCHSLTDWELEGLFAMTGTCRSLVIALAAMDHYITVDEAVAASRLEESFQVDRNGSVVAGHDLDIADTRVRFSSAAFFTHMVRRHETKAGKK